MQYAPTRVHQKPDGFWTQTFGEDCFGAYAIRPYTDTCKIWRVSYFHTRMHPKTHPISPIPIRIRPKPARFHIPPPEYAKNAPDFTLPNKDTPKTCPVLYPNLRRRTFRGVCNTPLHGYMKNPAGFIPKSSAQDISGRMLLRSTRIHEKFGRFWTLSHDIARNPAGFGLCHST